MIIIASIIMSTYYPVLGSMSDSDLVNASGQIIPITQATITVNEAVTIKNNELQVALAMDNEWKSWQTDSVKKAFIQDANVKIVRIFDWKSYTLRPCTSWNEAAGTGTFNWAETDQTVQRLLEVGAEPLFCLGATSGGPQIPSGMAINPATNLPYPDSFAKYAAEWVKHFKATGANVKYYEIWNEAFTYFTWNVDYVKLQNLLDVWNACAIRMKQEDPTVKIGNDFTTRKRVLDYWILYGEDLDFLGFHKYDSQALSGTGYYTDAQLLQQAETKLLDDLEGFYSIEGAKQVWFNARGTHIPCLGTEANLNSAWQTGTDPRMQYTVGAVWTGLMLRACAVKGVDYLFYFNFYSRSSINRPSGGIGYGLIDWDNNQPWYTYYVYRMIGKNLRLGDRIVESTTASTDIRTLAWVDNGKLNILIINKALDRRVILFQNINGVFTYEKIDNSIPYNTPTLQTGSITVQDGVVVNGYTVMLMQKPL